MVAFNPAITERLNALSDTLLNGHYIFSRDYDESYLARRFSKPEKHSHNISYGISHDPKHLQQYYKIREQAYKEVHNLKDFTGSEEYTDLISYLYLAFSGNNCVGGVRLTITSDEQPVELPIEHDFSVKEFYRNIDFTGLKYCEASRLALLSDFRRHGGVADGLILNFVKFLVNDIGVSLGFGRSTALQARRFKTQFNNLNLPYKFVIRNDVQFNYATEHDDVNLTFWAIDFTPDQRFAEKLEEIHEEPVKKIEFA